MHSQQRARRSIAERYSTKAEFLRRVQLAGEVLIRDRYLLERDLQPILDRADAHGDLLLPQPDPDEDN